MLASERTRYIISQLHSKGIINLKDIAKELKFAAEYSADEMKDSWKHAGEAVRNAASEIKADMSEVKESAQAVFKEDEETSEEKESV